jgi:hypothetical protein
MLDDAELRADLVEAQTRINTLGDWVDELEDQWPVPRSVHFTVSDYAFQYLPHLEFRVLHNDHVAMIVEIDDAEHFDTSRILDDIPTLLMLTGQIRRHTWGSMFLYRHLSTGRRVRVKFKPRANAPYNWEIKELKPQKLKYD